VSIKITSLKNRHQRGQREDMRSADCSQVLAGKRLVNASQKSASEDQKTDHAPLIFVSVYCQNRDVLGLACSSKVKTGQWPAVPRRTLLARAVAEDVRYSSIFSKQLVQDSNTLSPRSKGIAEMCSMLRW
jgi:hypothetical protein